MSYFGFLIHALALSPFVFFRYVPIVFVFGLIVFGLFSSTDNIYVIGLVMFLIMTVGQTFLYLTGIRGALVAAKATAPPTVEALVNVTIRMMFTQMLILLLMVFALSGAFYLIFSAVFLTGAAAEASNALGAFTGAVFSFDGDKIAEAAFVLAQYEDTPGPIKAALHVFNISVLLAIGISISIFGIPLAAIAANAVQKSPGNDLIYGIGRYFPHQMTLYILATIIPSVLLTEITPVADVLPGAENTSAIPLSGILLSVWGIYAPCVSWAGMAIGYRAIRGKMAALLAAERVPNIDYEKERENVKALRERRRTGASETTVYDPRAKIEEALDVGAPPIEDEEFEDEVRASLRAMRQSRRGSGGGQMYDPRNPNGLTSEE